MQIIVRSHYNVLDNITIQAMLVSLCLLSPQLFAAIEPVPVHRLDA
jgi:hypothetical protein